MKNVIQWAKSVIGYTIQLYRYWNINTGNCGYFDFFKFFIVQFIEMIDRH